MENRELFAADLGMDLAFAADTSGHSAAAEIEFVEVAGGTEKALERVFVKSWSTSGDADDRPTEEVAFYYTKMSDQNAASSQGSSSFGVEREMKESGEKGGTADINIGVGELQECTISKSMDWASTTLGSQTSRGVVDAADYTVWRDSLGAQGHPDATAVEELFAATEPAEQAYLKYKLTNVMVTSYS